MPTPIWAVELRAGKLVFDLPDKFKAHIGTLKPGRYELTVRKPKQTRGTQANRYYHGVVVAVLAEHLGDDRGAVHEALARHFLTIDPDAPLPRRRSTVDLDSAEFAQYVDDCRRLAAEMGVSIPGPNEIEA